MIVKVLEMLGVYVVCVVMHAGSLGHLRIRGLTPVVNIENILAIFQTFFFSSSLTGYIFVNASCHPTPRSCSVLS